MKHSSLIVLFAVLVLGMHACKPVAFVRPNVVLIYADDLGIGMLGCYGQQLVSTPNIDRLAEEGMRFTSYYGSVYCAPARYSLATGMHDGRVNAWNHSPAGLIVQRDAGRISEEEYQEKFARSGQMPDPSMKMKYFLAR